VPGFEASSWFGLVAPAKTPKAIVDLLAVEVANVLKDPEMQSRLAQSGARLVGDTPAEFRALIVEDRARSRKVIRGGGDRAAVAGTAVVSRARD